MKTGLFVIFICWNNLLFSQQNSDSTISNRDKSTSSTIVIDGEMYPLTQNAFRKIDYTWVLSVNTPTEDGIKNGEPIIIYGNSAYKEKLYQAIGLTEDNNIYTTLDSYASFKYLNGTTVEESVEIYFKKNYKLPENKRKKKYGGKVYLYVIVEKDGSLSNIMINKGINTEIDSSVVDMVKKMPAWIPAKIENENVRSKYLFGVNSEWFYQ